MKIVFVNLDEMIAELKEKGISEVRIDALFQEKNINQGIVVLKAFVVAGAILKNSIIAHFEKVVFKNLKPFRKEEVAPIIQETLQAENEIKESIAEQGFTVRDGYFAEAVS